MIFRENIVVFAEAGALPASALEEVISAARALDMDKVREEIAALRARQWLANHPQADAASRERILRMTRDAFYVDTPAWKAMAFAQARVAALQALAATKGRGR